MDVTLIEFREETVGLVTRDGRAFRFHAAHGGARSLEGRTFESVLAAERAARRLICSSQRAQRREEGTSPPYGGETRLRRRPPGVSERTRRTMMQG